MAEIEPDIIETVHYMLTAHLFAIKLDHLVKTNEADAGGVRVF